MKRLKGFRTYIFTAALGLFWALAELAPVVVPILGLPELHAVLPESWRSWVILLGVVGNIWLRSITTSPPGRPE